MDNGKKKFSGSSEASKKGTPLGLIIALSVAGGVVIGWAGTHFLSKPPVAPMQATSPAAATPPAQTLLTPPQQQQQYTPAPQPPGEAPPGKVWSVEHGHWHDAPSPLPIPALDPATVAPVATSPPAPAATSEEKKE